MKGQVAFESLLVMMVLITVAIYIASLFIGILDSTTALAVARNELSAQMNQKKEFASLDKIYFEYDLTTTTARIITTTKPAGFTVNDFNSEAVKQKIKSSTKYETIIISINGTES